MKKQLTLLIGTLIVVFVLVGIGQFAVRQQANIKLPTFRQRELPTPEVTSQEVASLSEAKEEMITIDFGDGKIVSGRASAVNVYEALKKLTEEKGISIKTNQYKYGLLVEKIGDRANSKNTFWSYSVNGKAGNIAADRYLIQPGDKVEWRYGTIEQ